VNSAGSLIILEKMGIKLQVDFAMQFALKKIEENALSVENFQIDLNI
jgi:hypothetical protein